MTDPFTQMPAKKKLPLVPGVPSRQKQRNGRLIDYTDFLFWGGLDEANSKTSRFIFSPFLGLYNRRGALYAKKICKITKKRNI